MLKNYIRGFLVDVWVCVDGIHYTGIVIGWNQELYEVEESVEQASLCAMIFEGSLAVTLPPLNIAIRDGTSQGGAGPSVQQVYIPTPNPDQFIFSVADVGPICTNIIIMEDLVLELTLEDFFADLSFTAGDEPERVTISPVTTEVNIRDNDCECY